MTIKVSNNQYGRPHLSDSWASCPNESIHIFTSAEEDGGYAFLTVRLSSCLFVCPMHLSKIYQF